MKLLSDNKAVNQLKAWAECETKDLVGCFEKYAE